MINVESGARLVGDQAPKVKNLGQWLSAHPKYVLDIPSSSSSTSTVPLPPPTSTAAKTSEKDDKPTIAAALDKIIGKKETTTEVFTKEGGLKKVNMNVKFILSEQVTVKLCISCPEGHKSAHKKNHFMPPHSYRAFRRNTSASVVNTSVIRNQAWLFSGLVINLYQSSNLFAQIWINIDFRYTKISEMALKYL